MAIHTGFVALMPGNLAANLLLQVGNVTISKVMFDLVPGAIRSTAGSGLGVLDLKLEGIGHQSKSWIVIGNVKVNLTTLVQKCPLVAIMVMQVTIKNLDSCPVKPNDNLIKYKKLIP